MRRQLYQKKIRERILLMAAVVSAWMLTVGGRLMYLQVVKHDVWQAMAERQQQRTIRITPIRGTIYDSAGRELAKSVEAPSIFAVPAEVEDVEKTAAELARVLSLNVDALRQKLSERREFVWIKRKVSADEATTVKVLNLPGIHFITENKRIYPNNDLAAHVLGYSGIDEVGLDGVELVYDSFIRGKEAYILVHKDARGRTYERTQRSPVRGQDIILTIDSAIQFQTEKELREAVRRHQARSGVAIVLEPTSGEILALANVPSFDPNAFSQASEQERRNRAVRDIYEPGSVFKIVTYAAALEEGVIKPTDSLDGLGGQIVLAGHTIRDHRAFSRLTVGKAIEESSNIAAIQVASRLGPQRLSEYIEQFGLGQRTGVDLPGEAKGIVHPPERWSLVSTGAIAIGQEVGVTALQMAAAVAAVANEGVWVRPHVVRSVRSRTGEVLMEAKPEMRRIISRRTARILAGLLEGVVLRGTGRLARLDGYSAAGKTGTAQQVDPRTRRYSKTRYVASFAGFAPARDPRVVVLVAIDGPRGRYSGGEVAAPVFKKIAEAALHALGVPPDESSRAAPIIASAADFSEGTEGVSRRPPLLDGEAADSADKENLHVSANPSAGAVNSLTAVMGPLPDELAPSERAPVTIPDFRNRGLRAVAAECSRLGLRLIVTGSGGRAVAQSPPPGTPVRTGATCRVEFQ